MGRARLSMPAHPSPYISSDFATWLSCTSKDKVDGDEGDDR